MSNGISNYQIPIDALKIVAPASSDFYGFFWRRLFLYMQIVQGKAGDAGRVPLYFSRGVSSTQVLDKGDPGPPPVALSGSTGGAGQRILCLLGRESVNPEHSTFALQHSPASTPAVKLSLATINPEPVITKISARGLSHLRCADRIGMVVLRSGIFPPLGLKEVQIRLQGGIAQSGSLRPIRYSFLSITQIVISVPT